MNNTYATNSIKIKRFIVTYCEEPISHGAARHPENALSLGGVVKAANDPLAAMAKNANAPNPVTPVTLVYGFRETRNLDPESGEMKFTIDLLNRALEISHQGLSQGKLVEIRRGMPVKDNRVRIFAQITHIDFQTARELLQSWSACLKCEYDFISIQSTLKKRLAKCRLSNKKSIKYTAIKNYAAQPVMKASTLAAARTVFEQFITYGDQAGFAALERYTPPVRGHASCIISSIFFRRTSKLALKWSHENNIPVNFDRDFTPGQALKKSRCSYHPITFSEYKFYKKHQFDNINERNRVHKPSPFYLRCLGKG